MTVIYNFIATSVLGIPFEKVYGFITYSNVLFIEYKIKWSMYLLIFFKLTLSIKYKSLYLEMSLNSRRPWWLKWWRLCCDVGSLGREDPLEKEMVTHSSNLAWRIPWTEEPGRLQSMGLQSQAWLSNYHSHSFLIVPFLNTMGNTTVSREALWALKALFSNWYSSATCPSITPMVLAYIFWELIVSNVSKQGFTLNRD